MIRGTKAQATRPVFLAGGPPLSIFVLRQFRSRADTPHPRSFKPQLTFKGCRIPSLSRRVRGKAPPIAGLDKPSIPGSDSPLAHSMGRVAEALCSDFTGAPCSDL